MSSKRANGESLSLTFFALDAFSLQRLRSRSLLVRSSPFRHRISVRQVSFDLPRCCARNLRRAESSLFFLSPQIPHRHSLRSRSSSHQRDLSSQPFFQRSPLELVSSKSHHLSFLSNFVAERPPFPSQGRLDGRPRFEFNGLGYGYKQSSAEDSSRSKWSCDRFRFGELYTTRLVQVSLIFSSPLPSLLFSSASSW